MKPIYQTSIFLLGLLFSLSTYAQNFNPDIVVDINGTGDFTSLQAAFDATPSGTPTLIYVKRGLYDQEKLIIPADKTNITLIGESRQETIISYDIYNCNDGGDGLCPDDKVALWSSNSDLVRTAATLTILADDFKAENITIQNTAAPIGQAQAITMRGDRNSFVNCDILAYQDTIYFWMAETSRAYFETCLIEGRTDYIYGRGIGFFNKCEIRSYGGGWITAPSSTINQDYGFVFYECNLTYKTSSPRPGDDGEPFRFGRPWQEYPKAAWLYCDIPSQLNPQGWGDKWNMSYSDTSTDLHLYEWANTGPGADMSQRADWAGLRALENQAEADLYEPEIVLKGTDDWRPFEAAPTVTVYDWDAGANDAGWLTAENWNPDGVPGVSEVANVDGDITINADGDRFEADLNLINGAVLAISSNSAATLLTTNQSKITAASTVSLNGTLKTKGATSIDVTGNLDISAEIIGVHEITKEGTGISQLNFANTGFSGEFVISAGDLQAKVEDALGNSTKIRVLNEGVLTIDSGNSIDVNTAIYTQDDAVLQLNDDITISEWYIDGVIQGVGQYDSTTNPDDISGSGKLLIGRPSQFTFISGLWDSADNYSPALLPEPGEDVIVDATTIEAPGNLFSGNMFVQNGGAIRLRSNSLNSECLGPVTMSGGTNIQYATSGTGFTLVADIVTDGDIFFFMNSRNTAGSVMNLPGTFAGSDKITLRNTNRTEGTPNSATVDLGGDNSNFTGTWDLTLEPDLSGGSTAINGLVPNAFGNAKIELSQSNQAIFNDANCAGDILNMDIVDNAKAILNVDVVVQEFTLNGVTLENGSYNETTNPNELSGTGSITVGTTASIDEASILFQNDRLRVNGTLENLELYNMLGQRVYQTNSNTEIALDFLQQGIYIVRYQVDGKIGALKFSVN